MKRGSIWLTKGVKSPRTFRASTTGIHKNICGTPNTLLTPGPHNQIKFKNSHGVGEVGWVMSTFVTQSTARVTHLVVGSACSVERGSFGDSI